MGLADIIVIPFCAFCGKRKKLLYKEKPLLFPGNSFIIPGFTKKITLSGNYSRITCIVAVD